MPDLSHRPTRYATAALALGVLLASSWPALDQRLSASEELAKERAHKAQLESRLEQLQEQLQEPTAPPRAPVAGGVPVVTSAAHQSPAGSAPSCASYPNQEAAQAAAARSPRLRAALDGDGDGKVCEQLKSARAQVVRVVGEPSAPQAKAEPVRAAARVVVPSKAALVASGHHFGLAAQTREEVTHLERSLGRETTMTGYFKGWDTPYDAARVRQAWSRGQVPVMTWESRPLANAKDTTDYSLSKIIKGAFDDYLTTYARQVAAAKMPLVIRFDHEMNGNWYRWSEFESKYGVQVGEYVKAWRHVHDVFRRNGANAYVTWLWSPNRIDNLGRYPSIDRYYPGDSYVDWVGMTGYFRPGDTLASFKGTFSRTLTALRALAPKKPIFLSEVGATADGGFKDIWMRSLWPGVAAQPDVVGLMYFNYAVTDGGHTNDWRITSSPEVFEAFKTGLRQHGYGRPTGKRHALIPRTARYPYPLDPPPAPTPTPALSPSSLLAVLPEPTPLATS